MTTTTSNVNKEHSVTNAPGVYGTAKDDHAPIGWVSTSGWRYRELLKFPVDDVPAGATVVSVILKMKTTSGIHTQQGSSPRLRIRRLTEGFAATGGAAESWRTDADPTGFSTSSGTPEVVTPVLASSEGTIRDMDITDIYEEIMPTGRFRRDGSPSGGSTNFGIEIKAYDESNTNNRIEFHSMRGAFIPRVSVTYTEAPVLGVPSLVAPVTTQSVAPTVFSFKFPTGDEATSYNIDVGTAPDPPSDLWTPALGAATPGTQQDIPYAGFAFPTGVPIYWRVRGEAGATVGAWANGTFTVQAAPTVAWSAPTASGIAEIWNMADVAQWVASEAKARIKVAYTHPQNLDAAKFEVSDASVVTTYTPTPAVRSGEVATLDLATGWARDTPHDVLVRAQGAGGQWSAWTPTLALRVQWGQGIYTFNHGAGATNFAVKHTDPTGGGKAQYLYRNKAGPGAWDVSPSSVVTPTSTDMDMLVRLSPNKTGDNPAVPTARLEWQAAGSSTDTPDFWAATAAAIKMNQNFRRFGVHSLEVTSTAAGYIHPIPTQIVSASTKYTLSVYVNAKTKLAQPLQLALLGPTDLPLVPPILAAVGGSGSTDLTTGKGDEDWQRLYATFTVPPGTTQIKGGLYHGHPAHFFIDAWQLEEGEVASGWKPGNAGPAVVLDVGGIAVDGTYGGIFRLKGSAGGPRDQVILGTNGLTFANDTQLASPSTGVLAINGTPITSAAHPNLATHDALGLATDAELTTHAGNLQHAQVRTGLATFPSIAVGAVGSVVVAVSPAMPDANYSVILTQQQSAPRNIAFSAIIASASSFTAYALNSDTAARNPTVMWSVIERT